MRLEKFNRWKIDLENRCRQWIESHPESTVLDTSSFYGHLTQERSIAPFKDQIDFRKKDRDDGMSEGKVEVLPSLMTKGAWIVKQGGRLVRLFSGANAQQSATSFANDLLNPRYPKS